MEQAICLRVDEIQFQSRKSFRLDEIYLRFYLGDSEKFVALNVSQTQKEVQIPCILKHSQLLQSSNTEKLSLSCQVLEKDTSSFIASCTIENVRGCLNTPTRMYFKDGPEGYVTVSIHFEQTKFLSLQNVLLATVVSKLKHALQRSPFTSFSISFEEYDPLRTGYVNRVDFKNTLLNVFGVKLKPKELALLLEKIENASTGKVYYAEIDKLMQDTPSLVRLRHKLQRLFREAKDKGLKPRSVFRHFDKSNEGKIGKKELQRGLQQLGFTLTIQELILLFGELDKDNDGGVSLSEFVDFINQADNNDDDVTPLWSPVSESKEDFGFCAQHSVSNIQAKHHEEKSVTDDKENINNEKDLKLRQAKEEIENLKRENELYCEKLEKAKKIITSLEERCAQAELSRRIQIERSAKNAIIAESDNVQREYMKIIQDRIHKTYGPNRTTSETDKYIQAHVALECELEERLNQTEAELRKCKVELKAERRKAFLTGQKLKRLLQQNTKDASSLSNEGNTQKISPTTWGKLTILSRESRSDNEDIDIGAIKWFDPINEGVGNLTLDTFNNYLKLERLPTFSSSSEFEEGLLYFKKMKWFSETAFRLWQDEALISCKEWCKAIDCFTLELEPTTELASESDEEKNDFPSKAAYVLNERLSRIGVDVIASTFEENDSNNRHLLSKLSSLEGIKIMNFGKTAELVTTRRMKAMSFLSVNISDVDTCYACCLRLNRCNFKGNWSLCVTGPPPSNRPCAGSCVYDSVFGTSGAFAWVEGYHTKHEAKEPESQFWILDKSEIEETFKGSHYSLSNVTDECRQFVRNSFLELYSRFFYPGNDSIILDEVDSLISKNANRPGKEEFVHLARELEAYFQKNHLREMQKRVASIGNGLRTEFNSFSGTRERPTISYDALIIIVTKLFGHLRNSNFDERKWLDIILDTVDPNYTNKNLSFEAFSDTIDNIHKMLLNRFNLTAGLADHYQDASLTLSKLGKMVPVENVKAGDVLSVTVYKNKARFYLNGKFQIELAPTCKMPWRFAWLTSTSSSATVLSSE